MEKPRHHRIRRTRRIEHAADSHRLTDARYRADGLPTHIGTRAYAWNPLGRLTEVRDTAQGTPLARYGYDHRGLRNFKEAGGRATRYLYGESRELVAELDQHGRILRQYLYLGDQPLALIDSPEGRALADDGGLAQALQDLGAAVSSWFGAADLVWLHTNHLGAPEAATDDQGQALWRADYAPFGKATLQTRKGFVLNLRLPGQYHDEETGLHYNIHRYYDPERGEYLTPDPLGLVDSDNRYAYANANPLGEFDSLGLFKIPATAFASLTDLALNNIPLAISDGGHADILRIAFNEYKRDNGNRFSNAIIDQIIRNNYDTDRQIGGQSNANNHWDNPNNGPEYKDKGEGGFSDRTKLPSYTDGTGDNWIQDALDQVNAKRMSYQNATYGKNGGFNISYILSAFGQNSHVLADFYAHTNWVDANTRGGCVKNQLTAGGSEVGYIPFGLGQAQVWNEEFDGVAMESIFSGTVSLYSDVKGCYSDISCSSDMTTHGYWNKDSSRTTGGGQEYKPANAMYGWEVRTYDGTTPVDKNEPDRPTIYGSDWYGEYGVTQSNLKKGDRIYVKVVIMDKFQLAFQLAVEHTKQEISRLYSDAASVQVGPFTLQEVFTMNDAALKHQDIAYREFDSKK